MNPLAWLGPSLLFFSPPFCVGFAFQACRRAKPKIPARAGLILAILELVALVAFFSDSVFNSMSLRSTECSVAAIVG